MKKIIYFSVIIISFFSFAQQKKSTPKYQLVSYVIDTLSINTEYSDFGISYLNDKEVLFSSPKKESLFTRKWRDNEQPYLELYKGSVTEKGEVVEVNKYSKELNSRYHEAELTITKKGKGTEVYFTSNNHIDGKGIKSSTGFNNLQLYKADIFEGEYVNIRRLPFNSKEFSTGHPVLADDDKTLYFISDRPGGYGQTDIYKVAILPNDEYGDLVNLGPKINSNCKEMFPFVDTTDDVLYFSSDREGGKGGLDVYAVPTDVLNTDVFLMKDPINSEYDDFAFVLGNGFNGFLSSNRDGGVGDDDIYKLTFDCLQTLRGTVYNGKTKKGLSNAYVYIYNGMNTILDSIVTDDNGTFNAELPIYCGSDYYLKALKSGYSTEEQSLKTPTLKNYANNALFSLVPQCMQTLQGFVSNSKTQKGLPNTRVYIYENEVLMDSVYTNSLGEFNTKLSISCESSYTVKATKAQHSTDVYSFNTSKATNYTNNVSLSLVPEFITNAAGKAIINIEPIYFDFNKANIRPDAAEILNKVVAVMNKYPEMVVEGGSHTDSRGSARYNEKLSSRRAKSTVDYIISKGISASRISSKGYGERQLTNRCADGVKCTDQEHDLNRRTEFVVIKY